MDSTEELIQIAREVEKRFGYIVVGIVKGFDIYEPGSIITAIWGVDLPEGVRFTVLGWGSLADWYRQAEWLKNRYDRNTSEVAKIPNARFAKLRRASSIAKGAETG